MKKILLFTFLSMAFSGTELIAQYSPPAVFSADTKAIEKNKAKVAGKDASLMPAFKQLIKEADKALEFGPVSVMEKKNDPPSGDKHDYMSLAPYFWPDPSKPGGIPYMRKDGETNPEVKDYKDKEYLPKLCEYVNTLGMAYYFSGDNKYAVHAAKLLRVWFLDHATRMNPKLNYSQAIKGSNDGRGAGLIDSRHFVKLIDGIGLISSSKEWTTADQQGMVQWFSDFLNWMQTSRNGMDEMNAKNNHGDWYDAQRLSMALFINDQDLAKKIVLNAESRLESQLDGNGFFPRELERTTSLHYSLFALQAFFNIARMGERTGVDFWSYESASGKSLKKAFNTLRPFLTKEKPWEGQQIKEFDFDEAIPVLADGVKKYGCRDCTTAIKDIAGDKSAKMITILLTDIDF